MTLRGKNSNQPAPDGGDGVVAEGSNGQPFVPKSALMKKLLRHVSTDSTYPSDYASELDHYLYGMPKQNGRRKKATRSTPKTKRGAGSSKPASRAKRGRK